MTYLPSRPHGTLMDAFQANPEAAEPLHRFAQAVMRGDAPFTPGEREAMAARVSAANGCAFCHAAHRHAAVELGLADDMADALIEHPAHAHPDHRMRPVLSYLDTLTRDPSAIGRADADTLLQAGWPDAALECLTLVCGFFNLMNRWVEGLGIPNEPATARAAGRMLARQGYAGISQMLARAATHA